MTQFEKQGELIEVQQSAYERNQNFLGSLERFKLRLKFVNAFTVFKMMQTRFVASCVLIFQAWMPLPDEAQSAEEF